MRKNNSQEIVIVHESLLSSWLKDIVMFGGICLLLWFNHRYLVGNTGLDFLFAMLVIIWLISRGSKDINTFYSVDEAIEYLKGLSK